MAQIVIRIRGTPEGSREKGTHMAGKTSGSDNEAAGGVTYGFGTTLQMPFAEAIEAVSAALKDQGFGVLTTIDVQATMKAKLDVNYEKYVILGACNPSLAHRALQLEHSVGLLLPCNVVVHEAHESDRAGSTRVDVIDPLAMLGVISTPGMTDVAAEARDRLKKVIASLEA